MITRQGGEYHPDLQTRNLTQDLDPADSQCKTHAFLCVSVLPPPRFLNVLEVLQPLEHCLLGMAGGRWKENRHLRRQEQGLPQGT